MFEFQLLCTLCSSCLSPNQEKIIKQAYLEHVNRHTWIRLYPVPFRVCLPYANYYKLPYEAWINILSFTSNVKTVARDQNLK